MIHIRIQNANIEPYSLPTRHIGNGRNHRRSGEE